MLEMELIGIFSARSRRQISEIVSDITWSIEELSELNLKSEEDFAE
jgi:hypothetical protein